MDLIDFLPLGLTCALALGAWVVALVMDRRVASSLDREPCREVVEETWFIT